MGLGGVVSGARRVNEPMMLAAARVLAANWPALKNPSASLLPPLADLRRVAAEIAFAVGIEAQKDAVAPKLSDDELHHRVLKTQWTPASGAASCRSPKLRKAINIVRVTMLQDSPHISHFKRLLDFGEGVPKKTKTIKQPVQTQTQTARMTMKKKKDGSYEFADVKYSAWKTDRTYTTSEVADKLLVSRETLYVWLRGKQIPEPKQIRLGKKTQYLWTDSDIEAAKERKLKGQSR